MYINSINKPCFVSKTHKVPGKVPYIQLLSLVLLIASRNPDWCICGISNVKVDCRASQLIFTLLMVGLSLAPSFLALMPVIPRNAYIWVQEQKLDSMVALPLQIPCTRQSACSTLQSWLPHCTDLSL